MSFCWNKTLLFSAKGHKVILFTAEMVLLQSHEIGAVKRALSFKNKNPSSELPCRARFIVISVENHTHMLTKSVVQTLCHWKVLKNERLQDLSEIFNYWSHCISELEFHRKGFAKCCVMRTASNIKGKHVWRFLGTEEKGEQNL